MFQRGRAHDPSMLLVPLGRRGSPCVYFCRLAGWSHQAEDALFKCDEQARKWGIVLEGGIPNPKPHELSYYREQMGDVFSADETFVTAALARWLPILPAGRRQELARGMTELYLEQKHAGKPDGAVAGLHVKMMCWLYYRFRRILTGLGREPLPLILCETSQISGHELGALRMLCGLGADVLLLETAGDSAYLRQDPDSAWSDLCSMEGLRAFPAGFCLKELRKRKEQEIASSQQRPVPAAPVSAAAPAAPKPPVPAPARTSAPPRPVTRSSGPSAAAPKPALDPFARFEAPARAVRPNVWIKNASMDAILYSPAHRGEDQDAYNTALIRMKGVRDKLTYPNDLYLFYRKMTENGRRVLVVNREFDMPTAEELGRIRRRGKYTSATEMAVDLAGNLPAGFPRELVRLEQRAYVSVIMEQAKKAASLNALLQNAVILLCWIRRYTGSLFTAWRETDLPCLILMGHCRTEREALFLKWLAMMPADILILAPNLSQVCLFSHPMLLEIEGEESLPEFAFPQDSATLQMRTVASHAEVELDSLLYTDSGLFRSKQFVRADALVLDCTQDEVDLYWDQANPYRPGFGTEGGTVRVPVLYAKESGMPEGDAEPYWQRIKKLSGAKDTLLFTRFPLYTPEELRQHAALAQKYLKDGRIRMEDLMGDKRYPYGALRREMQLHMLVKAQELLDQRLIRGIGENGMEYAVLSAVLGLPKEITRLIQAFDFAKRNPKLVCVHTEEREGTLEDAILLTFLSLVGFDAVIFTPTGYQSIERFLTARHPVEHQVGPYRFGVQMPDLSSLPPVKKGLQWVSNLLKRGF